MASIHKEVAIDATAAEIWDAIRDVGAIHTRLAREFVVDTKLDGDSRLVTFANGAVVRERLVTVEDDARRLVYSAVGGRFTHHNGSIQVVPSGEHRSRVIWIADLLPNELAAYVGGMMDQGCAAMKRTLETAAGERGTVQSTAGPHEATAR